MISAENPNSQTNLNQAETLHSGWTYTSSFGFLGKRKRISIKFIGKDLTIEKMTQSAWQRFLSLFFTGFYDKKQYTFTKGTFNRGKFEDIIKNVFPVYNSENKQVIKGKTPDEIIYNLFSKLYPIFYELNKNALNTDFEMLDSPEFKQDENITEDRAKKLVDDASVLNSQVVKESPKVKPKKIKKKATTYIPKSIDETSIKQIHKKSLEQLTPEKQQKKKEKINQFLKISCIASKTVNDQFLGHVLGDSFLGDTGLEGGKSEFFVEYLKNTLILGDNFFGIDADFSEAKLLLNSFQETETLLKSIPEIDLYEDKEFQVRQAEKVIANIAASLSEKVKVLKEAEQIVLPGGWRTQSGGHAMIYTIKKTEGNQYTFTCINTGDGINYHQSRTINQKEKFVDTYTISNISAQNICSQELYEQLYRLMIPYDKEGKYKAYNAADIYEKILPNTGGVRIEENNLKDDDFITPQRSGTCSWQSVTSLLALGIQNKQIYKQLIIGIKLQTLIYWMDQHQAPANVEKKLLKFSCEALSRQVIAGYAKGYITEEQLNVAKKVIANCFRKYGMKEERQAYVGIPNLSPFILKYDFDKTRNISEASEVLISNVSAFDAMPNLADLTPNNLAEKVTHFHEELQKCIQAGCTPVSAERAIGSFVAKLVLKTETSGFWKNPVGPNNIEEGSRALEQLMELHMKQTVSLPKTKQKEPEAYGISICLTNLIAQLCKHDELLSCVLEPRNLDSEKSSFRERGTFWFEMTYSRFFWIADGELRKAVALSDQNLEKLDGPFPSNATSQYFNFYFTKGKLNPYHSTKNVFLNLLTNPFFVEKMKQKDSSWMSLSDQAKVELLIEHRDKYVPPALNSLVNTYAKAILYTKYFVNEPTIEQPIVINRNWQLSEEVARGYNVTLGGRNKVPRVDLGTPERLWEKQQFKFKNEHFDQVISKKYFDAWTDPKFPTYLLIDSLWTEKANKASFAQKIEGFSQEETQALSFIDSNPTVSLPQLFNYLNENPRKLSNKDYQWYVLSHLFYGNALEQKLSESESLKNVWKEFLSSQMKFAKGENNQELLLFLLYLKRMFPVSSSDSQHELTEVLAELDKMESFLDKTNPDLRILRGLIAAHKIGAIGQLKNQTIDTATTLIKENLLYRAYAESEWLFLCQQNEIEQVVETSLNPFIKEFNLEQIAIEIGPYFNVDMAHSWETSQAGTYKLQNKTELGDSVEMDFLNGIVKVGPKFLGDIDKTGILEHEDFRHVFAGKRYELFTQSIASKANKVYRCVIYDEEDQMTKFYDLKFDHPNLMIQTENEGKLWTFVPLKQLRDSLLKNYPGLPFSPDLNYWSCGKSVRICTKNDELYARCVQQGPTNYVLERVNPGQPEDGLTLSEYSAWVNIFKEFTTFGWNRSFSSVLNWGNRCIELPGFGMKFTSVKQEGKEKLIWSENSAFWISQKQSLKTMPNLGKFIILENEQGEKKVLIPKSEILNTGRGALSVDFKLVQTSEKSDYYNFSVSHTGHIKGANTEENLYLAYLHIVQKNYLEANSYLDQKKINPLQGFSSSHYEIIKNIIEGFEKSRDQHPESIAVQLHLMARLMYHGLSAPNQLKDDKWFLEKLDSIPPLIKKYENMASHLTSFTLTEEDKLLLGIKSTVRLKTHFKSNTQPASARDPFLESFTTIISELSKEGIKVLETHREQIAPYQDFLAFFQENEKMPPATKRELKRMREEIATDCNNQNIEVIYQLEGDLEATISAIDRLSGNYLQEAKNLEEEILSLANKVPDDSLKRMLHQLSLFGKKTKNLSIDEIIIFCMQKNMGKIKEANPALKEEERERLIQLTKEFVIKANRYQKLERSRNKLVEAIAAESSRQKELVHESLSELTHDALIEGDEFELHVFSYYAEISFRPNQIDIIRKMRLDPTGSAKSQVFQLIMGSGKSKVILPLLAFLNSTGNNIPVFIVPDSLFETNSPDLKFASGEYLDQEIQTCFYGQNHELTIGDVKKLQIQLESVRKNKSYLLTSPWTMHLLQLNHQSIRDQLHKDPALGEMYRLISSVLQDLKKNGDLLCDEFDSVMDIDLEANRPIGPDVSPSAKTSEFIQDFFFRLFDETDLSLQLRAFSREEAQVDKANYETLKPKLGAIFLELLEKRGLAFGDQKNDWINYLCEKSTIIPPTADLSPDLMTLIGDARGMLNTLLYPAIKENPLQHYGLSQETACPFAIPFDQDTRKPKEGSEFSFYFETLVRTFLYYSKEFVPRHLIEKQIETYQNQAGAELLLKAQEEESDQEIALRFSKTYKKFSEDALFGSIGISLDNITPFTIDKIVKTINADPKLRLIFAKQHAVSQIKYYNEKVSSNPYTLVNMFRSTSGFTGTLANQDTYHPTIKRDPGAGIDGKSYNIFWKKSKLIPTLEPGSTEKGEVLSLFDTLIAGGYHALIDSGSWFRGIPNYKVAQDLLEAFSAKGSILKGVVFINDRDIPEGTKGTFVVLEKGKKLPKALTNSSLSPEERFTYYHLGTGLDMPQAENAKALMTESRNLTTRDIAQGCWRMRQLHRGQSVDFALPSSFGKSTMGALLLHHTLEQAESQEKQLTPSTFLLINSELKNFIENKFEGLKFDSEQDWQLYDHLRPLLRETMEDNSWKLFAQASNNEDTEVLFSNYIGLKMAILEAAFGDSETQSLADLKTKLHSYVPLNLLPRQIKQQKVNVGTFQLVHTQQKTEVQSESQTLSQTEAQQESIFNQQRLSSTKKTSFWEIYDEYTPLPKQINFFSEDFCKVCTRIDTLQSYLQAIKGQIRGVDSPEDFFSTRISFTGDYRCDDADYELGDENQVPFGPGTKPANLSLLIKNKKTKETQLIYLAPDEAGFLWRMFEMDKADPSNQDSRFQHLFSLSGRTCQVALYSPFLGIVQSGKETYDWKEMKHEPQMVALATETKFWNGSLYYTKEEVKYLKKWIARVGVKNFENMFVNNILRYRPEAQSAYPNSIVALLISKAKTLKTKQKVPGVQYEQPTSFFSYFKKAIFG